MPIPVLLAQADSYQVASKVHNLTVKTRPTDAEKISLIRDLVAKNVNVKKIINRFKMPTPLPLNPSPEKSAGVSAGPAD